MTWAKAGDATYHVQFRDGYEARFQSFWKELEKGSEAAESQAAHRDVRDQLTALLDARHAQSVPPQAAYALPFPVTSAGDAARLAVAQIHGSTSSSKRCNTAP